LRIFSHFFWSYAHNFNLGDPEFTTMLTDRIAEGFEEDKEMIEAQQIIVNENPDTPFAYIHFDRGLSAGRKALAKALAERTKSQRMIFLFDLKKPMKSLT